MLAISGCSRITLYPNYQNNKDTPSGFRNANKPDERYGVQTQHRDLLQLLGNSVGVVAISDSLDKNGIVTHIHYYNPISTADRFPPFSGIQPDGVVIAGRPDGVEGVPGGAEVGFSGFGGNAANSPTASGGFGGVIGGGEGQERPQAIDGACLRSLCG